MLDVTRYVNGTKVEEVDLRDYVVDSYLILATIKAVNGRLDTY